MDFTNGSDPVCFPCVCWPSYPQKIRLISCDGAFAFPFLDSVTAFDVREIIIRHSTFDCLPNPDSYLNLAVFLEEDNVGLNCSCVHQWVKTWPTAQFYTECEFNHETTSSTPQTPVTSANNQPSSAPATTSEFSSHVTSEAPTDSIFATTIENNSTNWEGRLKQHSHVVVIAGVSSALVLLIIIIVVLRVRKRLQRRRSLGRHSLLSYSMNSIVNPIYRDPNEQEQQC